MIVLMKDAQQELSAKLSVLTGRVAELCSEFAQMHATLQAELTAAGEQIAVRAAEIERQAAALAQAQADVDRQQAALTARSQGLDQQRAELEQREAELAPRAAETAARTREHEERTKSLDAEEADLRQHETMLAAMARRLELQRDTLTLEEQELMLRRKSLESLRQVLDGQKVEVEQPVAQTANPPGPPDDAPLAPPHPTQSRAAGAEPADDRSAEPATDGTVDASTLTAEQQQKLKVLRRITGGHVTDAELLARIEKEAADATPAAPPTEKRTKSHWWKG